MSVMVLGLSCNASGHSAGSNQVKNFAPSPFSRFFPNLVGQPLTYSHDITPGHLMATLRISDSRREKKGERVWTLADESNCNC